MADTAELRQRKAAPAAEAEPKPRKMTARDRKAKEDRYTPWIDMLRVLTFLFVTSCALSYLISSGESFTWGMKQTPTYLRLSWWKRHFVCPSPLPAFHILAPLFTPPRQACNCN